MSDPDNSADPKQTQNQVKNQGQSSDNTGADSRLSVAAIVVVVAVLGVVGGGLYVMFGQQHQETIAEINPPVATPQSTPVAPAPETTAENTETIRVEDNPDASGNEGPSFDVVRVDPSGELVVAGRADPKSDVTVKDQSSDITSTEATSAGEFVAVPEAPLPPGTHTLSLRSEDTSGEVKQSQKSVVIVVPEQDNVAPIALQLDADDGPVRVLQGPDIPDGLELTLAQIDFDEAGRATYQGTGRTGATIQIYVDNQLVGSTVPGTARRWASSPPDPVSVGAHELRLDQLDETGDVDARIVVSFEREADDKSDSVASSETAPKQDRVELVSGFVTVRRGNSLWRIARSIYGRGTQYTVIYESNQDQIRDPDLIYPGQVFKLPTR